MPLNHVALTVSDRETSAAFYGRHFGLTERILVEGIRKELTLQGRQETDWISKARSAGSENYRTSASMHGVGTASVFPD